MLLIFHFYLYQIDPNGIVARWTVQDERACCAITDCDANRKYDRLRTNDWSNWFVEFIIK